MVSNMWDMTLRSDELKWMKEFSYRLDPALHLWVMGQQLPVCGQMICPVSRLVHCYNLRKLGDILERQLEKSLTWNFDRLSSSAAKIMHFINWSAILKIGVQVSVAALTKLDLLWSLWSGMELFFSAFFKFKELTILQSLSEIPLRCTKMTLVCFDFWFLFFSLMSNVTDGSMGHW